MKVTEPTLVTGTTQASTAPVQFGAHTLTAQESADVQRAWVDLPILELTLNGIREQAQQNGSAGKLFSGPVNHFADYDNASQNFVKRNLIAAALEAEGFHVVKHDNNGGLYSGKPGRRSFGITVYAPGQGYHFDA